MADLSGFDASQVDPQQAFDCIPAGEYPVVIVASETKATKDGKGKYLALELQVTAGEFQNRKLFDRLNLWNANEKAVQIARASLSSICRAVNVLTPKDSSELHAKRLVAKVVVKDDPEFGKRNEIKAYKPVGATVPASAPVASAPAAVGNPW